MGYDSIKIGSRLQELRKQKRISQKEMADMRGLSQSLLSKQESGVVSIDAESLVWYADFYGVAVDYLLCRTDVPNIYVTTGIGEYNATLYTSKSPSQQEQEQAEQTINAAVSGKAAEISPALRQVIEQIVHQVLEEQGKPDGNQSSK